ncbi:LPP20 family lipoprotein [Nitrospirota bacterium]
MKAKRLMAVVVMAAMSVFMFYGCGGDEPVVKDTGMESLEQAPKWVLIGGAAFPEGQGRAFYGVGSAPKMRDRSMQRQRAKLRATDDLASQMETYVSSLQKDYAASTSDGNAETVEDHFEVVRKQVTAQTLSGVQFSDVWFDKENGEMFVLVKLDFVAFKDSIEKAKELNGQVKEYIRQNSERMHDELREEEEKRQ